jgi:hypothetical protein
MLTEMPPPFDETRVLDGNISWVLARRGPSVEPILENPGDALTMGEVE